MGIAPSTAPTICAAETETVSLSRFFVAQESYPAPLDTTTCAFCRVSTAVVFGSNVWASSVVEDRIEVTLTCTPPICSAKAPHWLTDATTLIGVVCSFGVSGAVG